MSKFWNLSTILLVILILSLLLFALINFTSLEIANSIMLASLFVAILSTLYSNYKSDERVNKQIETSKEQFKEQLLFNKNKRFMLSYIKS